MKVMSGCMTVTLASSLGFLVSSLDCVESIQDSAV